MRLSAVCLILLAAACAPSGPPRGFRGPPPEGFAPRGPRLFVSPAGEPFRGGEGAEGPMAAWFAGADADHDGTLTFAEFQADFRRYFAVLDTDHDREIAPAEVTRYETEILPEMASGRGGGFGGGQPHPGMGGMGPPPGGRGRGPGGMGGMRRGGGGFRGGAMGGGMAMGAARFGLLPIPHPIMAADEDLNRGVSPTEFDRAAITRFNQLDEAHDGRLTLAQLAARRMQGMEARGGGRRRGPPPRD